jgi:CheY-like chemotaxis protein
MTKRLIWSDRARGRIESGSSRFTSRACLEPRTVRTLGEFVESVGSERPDLVVLDLESSELPAAAACERLRADGRTAAVPVLILAGETSGEALPAIDRCEILPADIDPVAIQERIASALGLRLRRHPRYPVVLPVARGRIFHEFLGYSNEISEAGMGFDTIARIRSGDRLDLKIYRSTEEKPIGVTGRVCGVRPNIDTGVGYAVGVEFMRLATVDKQRLVDLFPEDPCVTWGSDPPGTESPAHPA